MKWWQWLIIVLLFAGMMAFALLIRRGRQGNAPAVEVRTDTVWTVIHDTVFTEVERRVVRHDTVRLAVISKMETTTPTVSGLEIVDSAATAENYSAVDSVEVSVPIERTVFEGDRYMITATGYRVALEDVTIAWPTVTTSTTVTRTKRWNFTVGVQAGYGITMGGLSPYAGLGFTFGYTF